MKKQILFRLPLLVFLALGLSGNSYSLEQTELPCTLGGSLVAGMVVHIDPHTGQPTTHPLPEQSAALEKLEAARANRSTVGLVEEKGPTGGMMVNLRNRFRSPLIAVKKQDGSVRVDHLTCQPVGE